jgi:hypothetical protein
MADIFFAVCHYVLHVVAAQLKVKGRMSLCRWAGSNIPFTRRIVTVVSTFIGVFSVDVNGNLPVCEKTVVGGDDWFVREGMAMRL